ncbi:MAG: GNAT family acetyltransferase [Pseudomonadales bacterium]
MIIQAFEDIYRDEVIALWRKCELLKPWNDPDKDISRKLSEHPELFLIGLADTCVVATAMGGYDGHRGWVNYLAVDPDSQHQGLGRTLMTQLEERLIALGCPKINLQVRSTNPSVIAFYRSCGYAVDEVTSMGKRLISDLD